MKTRQETFDVVVKHLLAQNAHAAGDNGTCLYRAPGGRKCAVGCLIADEHYSPEMEGKGAIGNDRILNAIVASGYPPDLHLLSDLQATHDGLPASLWPAELRRIASKFNLTCPTEIE